MDDAFSSSNPSHSALPGIFPKFTEAELSPELSPSQDWEKAEQSCKMALLWCILYNVYFCILQQHSISELCSVRDSLWAPGPFLKANCLLKHQPFSTEKKHNPAEFLPTLGIFLFFCKQFEFQFCPPVSFTFSLVFAKHQLNKHTVILWVIQNTEHDLEGCPFHCVNNYASILQESLLNHVSQDCLWYFK